MIAPAGRRVILIRNAFFYDFGGAERYPIYLADELIKLGYKPIVVSRFIKLLEVAGRHGHKAVRGWWWSHQNWSGYRVALIPFYLLWQIVLFSWYLTLFLSLRPGIVHPMSKDDFIAATLAGRLLGKKVVWTDHADLKYIYANHKVWFKNPVGKLVYLLSKLAARITIASHNEYREIEAVLGQKLDARYRVVYNGIADRQVIPHERPVGEEAAFVFSATSRLVEAKGIGELIEAFKKVKAIRPDARLWLVGDGPDADKFKKQAEGVEGIHFVGYSDEALSYVASADAFVHPSYHEAFSLSLIEAAMLAKPIIAGRVGGNQEIVKEGENGILVPVKDTDALTEAMLKLIVNKSLAKQMGTKSRQIYEAQFRFDDIVKRDIIPIYEED